MDKINKIMEEFEEMFTRETFSYEYKLMVPKMKKFLERSLLEIAKSTREELRRKIENQKIDILGQFCYQGPPTKGWLKKELPQQKAHNQTIDKILKILDLNNL